MITTIIDIGNSRGIRIPKPLLNESGLGDQVEIKVKKGEIKIVAAKKKRLRLSETMILSENTLAVDWDKPEEDKAWESLQ